MIGCNNLCEMQSNAPYTPYYNFMLDCEQCALVVFYPPPREPLDRIARILTPLTPGLIYQIEVPFKEKLQNSGSPRRTVRGVLMTLFSGVG